EVGSSLDKRVADDGVDSGDHDLEAGEGAANELHDRDQHIGGDRCNDRSLGRAYGTFPRCKALTQAALISLPGVCDGGDVSGRRRTRRNSCFAVSLGGSMPQLLAFLLASLDRPNLVDERLVLLCSSLMKPPDGHDAVTGWAEVAAAPAAAAPAAAAPAA